MKSNQFKTERKQRKYNTFKKNWILKKKNRLYTCKQPPMIAYESFKSAQDNFVKFIHQFQPKICQETWKHPNKII